MNLVIDFRLVVALGAALAGLAVGYLTGWLVRARRDASLRRLLEPLAQALDQRVARLEGLLSNEPRGVSARRRSTSDHLSTTVFARPPRSSSTPPSVRREEAKTAVMTFDPFADHEHAAHR